MKYATIEWQGAHQNQPYSLDFNDVYFNTDSGIAETEYVFIKQNQLGERFLKLKDEAFTIIETGFGTGLNFYSAAAKFLTIAPENSKLHYISIEKFPISLENMQKMAQFWAEFSPISTEFLSQYIALKPNLNSFTIANHRIRVDLWLEDIATVLPLIKNPADAWFLDGFAPSKNTEMWSQEVFIEIARLSKPDSTFATFTSAGAVRRGLQAAGFNVQKHIGFGKKREMLCGSFMGNVTQ